MPIEQKVTRKLRAILSADVKGYSILMADDEVSTVQTLKDYRSIMSTCIEQHNGRVVDAVGDNLLAEFGSAVDAVQCAVDVQKKLNKKNEEISDDKRLQFRIGVNIGDVIQDGERIFGDGVNIAARIEGLADAGGISISRNAYDHIKNKLNLGYEYIGEHDVKNIKDPVRVYKVLLGHEDAGILIGEKPKNRIKKWVLPVAIIAAIIMTSIIWHFYQIAMKPDIEPASIENMALQLPDKPSIAVLPFNNFSKDPGQEYIADGITEHIITTLSKSERLFIIARNSVFKYKGKPVAIKQISEDLGVKYILEGSVQISNNKIRITAQLIDAIRGSHIWAQTYDKNLGDIFHLQDEIALQILKAMRVELTEGEQAKVSGTGTDNLKAYLQYLKCIEQLNKFTKEGTALARKAAQAAIDIDPMYSSGYRLLAAAHLNDLWLGVSEDPKLSIKKAFKLLEKVHALDENNPGHYYLKGQLLLHTRQHDKAITFGEQAVNLSPNNAGYIYALATILRYNGEHERALPLQKRAIRLNPYPPSPYYMSLGHIYLILERYEEAIQAYRKAVHLNPEQFSSHMCLAAVYSRLGLKEEARAAMSETLALRPKLSIEYIKTLPFRHKRDLDFFITALVEAGLPKHSLGKEPDKPSIAVLPFVNMSNDPEQEFFADGMTDELLTNLSKVSGLLVISRNSSFVYKGKTVTIQQVADELKVKYVLEGSIQRAGDRVRIRAQLIDGATDHHLWAETYDAIMENIFDLQDRITNKIAAVLAVKLTTKEQNRLANKETINIQAYDAFVKGWELLHRETPDDLAQAISLFKEAIELDNMYSRAHAALAWAYLSSSLRFKWQEVLHWHNQVRLMARKHLELAMRNPTSTAHLVASKMAMFRRRYEDSITHAQLAIAFDANDPDANLNMAQVLIATGNPEEGLDFANKVLQLDPRNIAAPLSAAGMAYFVMGDLQKAATMTERAIALNPTIVGRYERLSAIYALLDRKKDAQAAYKNSLETWNIGRFPANLITIMSSFLIKDRQVADRYADGLVKAGWPGKSSEYYKIYDQNILTGEEIGRLVFGQEITIEEFGKKYWFVHSENGRLKDISRVREGKWWIEGEMLCHQLESGITKGLNDCGEIYQNPDSLPGSDKQYLYARDYSIATLTTNE